MDLTLCRAYIAASRRSDRSLEARVESARRASEIHKRRTGRSLRVTEQDVLNEEMYEEEDDDLPMQYRRLTAHLQTTNADFDRRLAAYLTNHVAMRTALGAAVSDNYVHPQYTNAPQFANQAPQFPQQQFSNPMLPPQTANRSPQSFRQAPYPILAQHGQRANAHGRAVSVATPQELQGHHHTLPSPSSPVTTTKPDRRMSLPVQGMPPASAQSSMQAPTQPLTSPGISRNSSSTSLANLKHEAAQQALLGNGGQQTSPKQERPFSRQQPSGAAMNSGVYPSPFTMPMSFGNDGFNNNANMMPFATTLPLESQQLLAPGVDMNDPYTAMLFGGQDYRPQQAFYSYNPNGSSKTKGFNTPSYDGMNQTLAPGMLDTHVAEQGNYSTSHSASPSAMTPQSGGFFGFDASYADAFKPTSSGLVTPGEHDWASLIDAGAWEEPSQQSAAA